MARTLKQILGIGLLGALAWAGLTYRAEAGDKKPVVKNPTVDMGFVFKQQNRYATPGSAHERLTSYSADSYDSYQRNEEISDREKIIENQEEMKELLRQNAGQNSSRNYVGVTATEESHGWEGPGEEPRAAGSPTIIEERTLVTWQSHVNIHDNWYFGSERQLRENGGKFPEEKEEEENKGREPLPAGDYVYNPHIFRSASGQENFVLKHRFDNWGGKRLDIFIRYTLVEIEPAAEINGPRPTRIVKRDIVKIPLNPDITEIRRTFSNLKEGTYELQIQRRNDDGTFDENSYSCEEFEVRREQAN